jgi:hypothetical protein
MSATAISIAHNGWLVLVFSMLTLLSIGAGFIMKAKLRRKENKSE